MRLAIIVALSPDRRSGQVVSGILPADQAIAQVKETIVANMAFEGFPILGAFALDSCLRQHRFKDDAQILPLVGQETGDQSPGITLIAVEVGEGENKVIISVATPEEAKFVQDLAASVIGVGKEVTRLREALALKAEQITKLEADLQRETAYKAEVNQRIATLEADLKAAQEKLNAPATTGPAEGDLLTPPPSTPHKKRGS